MATGHPAKTEMPLGQALATESEATVSATPYKERSGIRGRLNQLIQKLLEKDPERRPQSASEVEHVLSRLTAQSSGALRVLLRPIYLAPAIALLTMFTVTGVRLYQRSEQQHWVREQAIPEMTQLTHNQPLAAFLLLRKAEQIRPGDDQLATIAQSSTRSISVDSTPRGATVEIQDYVKPGAWFRLGVTPLNNARVPNGYFRWRISKPGAVAPLIAAPETANTMHFTLPSPAGGLAQMDMVPAGHFATAIDFVGWSSYDLPAFDMDRYEVTNRQYQEFVDQGGYQNPKFWKEPFVRDRKELTWQQAMTLFRDTTGHPGPSAWKHGHFPASQPDYPVSGVSWYEAAAFAVFAGKELPVLSQWYRAAPANRVVDRIRESNFNHVGPVLVGTFAGVGPYGAYDLNGNVREWCLNAVDDRRFILGGAWGTQSYQAFDPEALPPFNRDALNGFRCVRNKGPLPPGAVAPIAPLKKDFAKVKPPSDQLFRAFEAVYAYDHVALNPKPEGDVENANTWTKQKIVIDAGYGEERLPLFLFLPKNAHPPYQTVLFAPSVAANLTPSSKALVELPFIDYVINSGRALVYPVFIGSYERSGAFVPPGSVHDFERLVQQSKEIGRSLDYLETRSDIDKTRIAYIGLSSAAAAGVIFTALEPRFRTVVLLSGGFFLTPVQPAVDQINFVSRLTKPVLMINGRYDYAFSPDRAQEPMFRMLGTRAEDKRRVLLDTPHDVSQDRATMSREVLGWLDKYLGQVR